MRRLLESRYFPAVCLGASFLVRLAWMLLVDPKPVSDFDWYFAKGIDLYYGRGYQEHGAPTAYWPVGYPAFLGALFALFGRSLLVARLANILLYLGVVALSSWLAGRLFRSTLTARLTLLLLAFHPNHIAYTSLVASESLFMFLMLLGIAVLLIARSRFLMAILAGAIFGLACLVRPQLLPIPLIAVLLLPQVEGPARSLGRRLLLLATVYATLLVVLVPWTIRNYRAYGHVLLVSTNGGGNLLIGNNPWATGAYIDRPEYEGIEGRGDEYQRDRRAQRYAIDYMREHPLATLKLWPRKFWYLYRGDVEGTRWSIEGIEARGKRVPEWLGVAVAVSEAYYLFLGAACAMSLLFFLKAARRGGAQGAFPLLGLGVIAYFTFLGVMFYGGSRYHFPVMPWVAMYAAALPEAFRASRRAPAPVPR